MGDHDETPGALARPEADTNQPTERPTTRRLVGGWLLLGAGLLIVGLALFVIGTMGSDEPYQQGLVPIVFTIVLALAAPPLVAGIGVLRNARWGRRLGLIVGSLYGLLGLWSLVSAGPMAIASAPTLVFSAACTAAFLLGAVLLLDRSNRREPEESGPA